MSGALTRASIATFGMRIVQATLGFANSVIIARMLGPEGLGLYAATLAILAILTIPADLGTSRLAPREVSRAIARNSPETLVHFVKWARKTITRSSIIIAAAVLLAVKITPDLSEQLYMAALFFFIVPLTARASFAAGVLRGMKHVILGQSLDMIRTVSLLAGLGALVLLPDVTVMQVLIVQILASILGNTVVCALANRAIAKTSAGTDCEVDATRATEWKLALPAFAMIAGLAVFGTSIDVIMIEWLSGAAEAGIYQVALQGANAASFGLMALSMTLAPYISESLTKGRTQDVQRLATKSSRAAVAYSALVLAAIILFGRPVLATFFGEEFSSAYLVTILICLGILINSSTGSSLVILSMGGLEKTFLKIVLTGTSIKIAANLYLVPAYGAAGAAMSVVLFYMTVNILFWWSVKKYMSVDTFAISLSHNLNSKDA